jgi:Flp pilus assembly protein TadD
MSLRNVALSSLVLAVVIVLLPRFSPATAGDVDWSALAAIDNPLTLPADGDEPTGSSDTTKKKSGNGFVRALGAPFRAFGRLFGGGKKNGQQTSQRITEKEARKFESAKISRVKDARVETPAATDPSLASTPLQDQLKRGRELLAAGHVVEAINELSAAASLNPKSGEAHNLLGVAYESKGMRDRALKSFADAVKADKDNPQYLNNYGFLLYKSNDFDAAAKYLKRAAKFSSKDPRIWNNLALAQCQMYKFDDAFKSFVHAVGEFDANVNIAVQLQRQGYAKDAIKHLEQANELRPNSTDALAKLANLYELTGRHSDAETARRSIVALRTFAEANK